MVQHAAINANRVEGRLSALPAEDIVKDDSAGVIGLGNHVCARYSEYFQIEFINAAVDYYVGVLRTYRCDFTLSVCVRQTQSVCVTRRSAHRSNRVL